MGETNIAGYIVASGCEDVSTVYASVVYPRDAPPERIVIRDVVYVSGDAIEKLRELLKYEHACAMHARFCRTCPYSGDEHECERLHRRVLGEIGLLDTVPGGEVNDEQ